MQSLNNEIEATLGVLSHSESTSLPEDVLTGVLSRIETGEIERNHRSGARALTLVAAAVVLLAGVNLAFLLWPGNSSTPQNTPSTSWIDQEYNLNQGSYLNLEGES